MNSPNQSLNQTGNPRTELPPQVNLQPNLAEPDFWIDMESFFDFSFWLAEELQDLIDRHRFEFGH